jgi:hypothetical protein
MIADLESGTFLRVVYRETKTSLGMILVIDIVVIKRLGVFFNTSSIGVRARGDLKSVGCFETIRTMLSIDKVGNPDTLFIIIRFYF